MMKKLSHHLVSSFLSSRKLCSMAESTLKIGVILRQRRIFTVEDVSEYSKISYDSNPLHFDNEVAQKAGFQGRIVHGMLVASLFPQIISSHFPGSVYVSQSLQFRQPVYVGNEIIGEVQATNIRAFKKNYLVKFSTRCLEDGNVVALDGEATAILPSLILQSP